MPLEYRCSACKALLAKCMNPIDIGMELCPRCGRALSRSPIEVVIHAHPGNEEIVKRAGARRLNELLRRIGMKGIDVLEALAGSGAMEIDWILDEIAISSRRLAEMEKLGLLVSMERNSKYLVAITDRGRRILSAWKQLSEAGHPNSTRLIVNLKRKLGIH